MSEDIVDRFEAIDVNINDCQRRFAAPSRTEFLAEQFLQRPAVMHSRERVDPCGLMEFEGSFGDFFLKAECVAFGSLLLGFALADQAIDVGVKDERCVEVQQAIQRVDEFSMASTIRSFSSFRDGMKSLGGTPIR
jgi:hypothetical protein